MTRAILDEYVEVGAEAVIGSSEMNLKTEEKQAIGDDSITLLGRHARVPAKANIACGARLKPQAGA